MRIGIITQPLMGNYGGLLQNYALQQTLRRLGHDPITLDQKSWHLSGYSKYKMNLMVFVYNLIYGKKKNYYGEYERLLELTLQNSRAFVETYIATTEKMTEDNQFRSKCIDMNLDALIVGSDQVWRPHYAPKLEQSFLCFAKGLPLKKIAYAVSFGVDEWEYTVEETKRCSILAKQFDAISVREKSGIGLCSDYLGVGAVHVLDPTMLLDEDDYNGIIENRNTTRSNGTLFAYILDQNDDKVSCVNNISDRLGIKPFYVNQTKELRFAIPEDINEYIYPPVEQWLRSFRDAEYVVCDSFHGMVFSLIYHKNFVVIANKRRGVARFKSLLDMLDLENRLVDSSNKEVLEKILNEDIDWNKVNEKRNQLFNKSINFLVEGLN